MITYLYSVNTSECLDKEARQKKVIEEINFLKGQFDELDDIKIIGIPTSGESNLGVLYLQRD